MIGFQTSSTPGILHRRAYLRPGLCPIARGTGIVWRAFIEDKASGGHSGRTADVGTTAVPPARQLICIDYKDLAEQKDLTSEIEKALGPNGLGAIIVKGVPRYRNLREALLPLAQRIAALPDNVKDKYVDPDSYYSFGWSHGKESLAAGVLDTLKGSFYANPLVDDQLNLGSDDWRQPWAFQQSPAAAAAEEEDQKKQQEQEEATRGTFVGDPQDVAPQNVPTDAVVLVGTNSVRRDAENTGAGAVGDGGGVSAATTATATRGSNANRIRSEAEVLELRRAYPEYFHRNLWPREEVPELEVAFKDLGRLICAVGCLLAEHCDRYVSAKLETPTGQVSGVLRRSLNPKARLLHYFPPSGFGPSHRQPHHSDGDGDNDNVNGTQLQQHGHGQGQGQHGRSGTNQLQAVGVGEDLEDHEQAWCGLHTDHGSLTGLTAAMYLDEQGREVPSPDPEAGLYIRDRSGQFVCARIPADCIAFQVGEALQVHSGGLLTATPHYVKAPRRHLARGISRNTFAVFMQPDVMEPINCPPGADPERVAVGQWRPGCTFGEFAAATFQQYYSKT